MIKIAHKFAVFFEITKLLSLHTVTIAECDIENVLDAQVSALLKKFSVAISDCRCSRNFDFDLQFFKHFVNSYKLKSAEFSIGLCKYKPKHKKARPKRLCNKVSVKKSHLVRAHELRKKSWHNCQISPISGWQITVNCSLLRMPFTCSNSIRLGKTASKYCCKLSWKVGFRSW